MDLKWYYVRVLGDTSKSIYHENLVDCMEFYGVSSLQELNVVQLRKYCYRIGVLNERK